jgi:hypothetical protein
MSALAEWLVRQAPAWLDGNRPLTPAQRRALTAIVRCRTPALGGHVYRCTSCNGTDFAYHSCHHRACPRCGGAHTAEWTMQQEERLLPVPYFLVTFTVPEQLRFVFTARPDMLHDLFFAAAGAALQEVARRPRLLGAELGFVGVLHTWGRQLQHHPHLHFIVPGGGLSADGKRWVYSRQPDWLLPAKAIAAAFRDRFEAALREHARDLHAQVPDAVWRIKWGVDTHPAGTGVQVVRYLARYVCRTAISDERIVRATDEAVTFRYIDSQTKQRRECMLSADEFMRRYLQHVLPPGQHRVRYFGWMHPAAKRRRIIVETLLAKAIVVRPARPAPPKWHLQCRHCGTFTLVAIGTINPNGSVRLCHRATGPPVYTAA